VSGNLEAIDIDAKHDPTILDRYQDALGEFWPEIYPKLVIQRTPSGGCHFIYRCPLIEGNQKLASSSSRESLIETRGEGGYIVLYPSPGYELCSERTIFEIETITPDERERLFDAARSLNEYWEPVKAPQSKAFTQQLDGLPPWTDYDQRADVPALLQSHGWQFLKSIGENDHYCRPGKKGSTSATWKESLRLFYCFTSSTVLEPSKAYSPSALFAKLECNGDFAQAAQRLYSMGYGERANTRTNVPKQNTTRDPKHKTQCQIFRLTKPTSMERPKKLFGPLWAEGENAFLFGEDGSCKTILSTQIGCSIATGHPIPGFQMEVMAQPVALIDAELSDYQFNTRYPAGLPDNFKRFTFSEDQQSALIQAELEFVVDQIEAAAKSVSARIIILDNLSALTSMVDCTKTSDSIRLMGLLNELRKKGHSVLIIDHTRKPIKDQEFKPISKHDLQGSKMKTNLVDSVFAIGKSIQGESFRYIKAIKIRSYEMAFTKNGVATMQLKTDPLHLEYIGLNGEWEHTSGRGAQMMQAAANGKSQKEIGELFGVTQQSVSKSLRRWD
jgi:hypothetical protein